MMQITKDVAEKVLHSLVDRLLGVSLPAPNYSDYQQFWTLNQWSQFIQSASRFLLGSAYSKDPTTTDQLLTDPVMLEALKTVVSVRHADLKRAAADSVCREQPAWLADFDWQLSLVMGSDKISSIEEPILSVELDVREGETKQPETVEFDLQQLDEFISTLESAQQELMSKLL